MRRNNTNFWLYAPNDACLTELIYKVGYSDGCLRFGCTIDLKNGSIFAVDFKEKNYSLIETNTLPLIQIAGAWKIVTAY